jgi:hypothetical protein
MLSNINNVPVSFIKEVKYLRLLSCTFSETDPVVHAQVVCVESMELSFQTVAFANLTGLHLFSCSLAHISRLNEYLNFKSLSFEDCTFNQANEILSCQNLNWLTVSAHLLVHLTDCSMIRNFTVLGCHDMALISPFYNSTYVQLAQSSFFSHIPHFKLLKDLTLYRSRGMAEFEISMYLQLKSLDITDCPDLRKIIINGSSLRKLSIEGNFPALQIIDVQTPSLKRCYLAEFNSAQDIMFFRKHKIPIFVVNIKGKKEICFA